MRSFYTVLQQHLRANVGNDLETQLSLISLVGFHPPYNLRLDETLSDKLIKAYLDLTKDPTNQKVSANKLFLDALKAVL